MSDAVAADGGTAIPGPGLGGSVGGGQGELAGLHEELAGLRGALAAAQAERDAAQGAAAARVAEAQAATQGAEQAWAEAEERALMAHRRAVLAELQGQVIPELINGNTVEEIDASVEGARAAFARAVEVARQQIRTEQDRALALVPMGGTLRDVPLDEHLSPLDRISRALNGKA